MPQPILTITQVARRLGVQTRTIRVYEREGFVTLERLGGRYYLRPGDVEVIAMVERLKTDLGVNLAGVGVIMEMRHKLLKLQEQMIQMELEYQRRLEEALNDQRREIERPLSTRGTRAVLKIRTEDD
ncbi:MAG: MerR family transcriptional regulator [Proteobacteria bacterium]|nr:MerR family transcriptional regulator [Pseudomonadota bacterium]